MVASRMAMPLAISIASASRPWPAKNCGGDQRLGAGGALDDFVEDGHRFVSAAKPGQRLAEQTGRSPETVFRIGGRHAAQIGDRGFVFVQLEFGDAAAIEGIDRVGARGEGLIECFARLAVALLIEQQLAELLVVAGGWIQKHQAAQNANPFPARGAAQRSLDVGKIGQPFDEEIGQRSDDASDDDDPEPEGLWAFARPVNDRRHLEEEAVAEEVPEPRSMPALLPERSHGGAEKQQAEDAAEFHDSLVRG